MSDGLPCVFCAGDPTEGLVVLFDGIRERPVCKRCLDDKLHLDARVSPKLKRPGIWLLMCRNCKHWANEGHYECDPPYFDEGAAWGYCILTDVDRHKVVQHKGRMYANVDQGDYPDAEPVIKTRHDFGCVMFEAKGGE